MGITIGGIAGLLIGFATGGAIFLIVGIGMADRFWRKKMIKVLTENGLDAEKIDRTSAPDAHIL